MNIEDIQAICKTIRGVTEDIKWGDHLCFNVGGKMFLITAADGSRVLLPSKLMTRILKRYARGRAGIVAVAC